jgi:hypothetical protein
MKLNLEFKTYFELFGSFNYHVPEDKSQQLYDFYMLGMLHGTSSNTRRMAQVGIMSNPQQQNQFGPGHLEDEEVQIDYMLKEASDVLLPHLKEELLNVLVYCTAAELKHVMQHNDADILEMMCQRDMPEYLDSFRAWLKTFKKGKRSIESSDKSYAAVQSSFKDSQSFMKVASWLFSKADWNENFGGRAWVAIVNSYFQLLAATSKPQLTIAIDHVYDLEHNTGTLFDKVTAYSKEGSYAWLKTALDHKARIRSAKELLPFVSQSMKQLAMRAIQVKKI